MRKNIITMAFAAVTLLSVSSCRTTRMDSDGDATEIIESYTGSVNDVNLEIASEPITHTIDISTSDGRAKLNKISLNAAKGLALREAIMKAQCAKLVNPQYTHLLQHKSFGRYDVLRITVYGFPAVYKNQAAPQYNSRTRQEIDINVNR